MGWFSQYAKSSIGMKQLMAVTGLALAGFVLIHMLGNLQMFLGPDAINSYAANLQALGALLWVARGGLILVVLVHIFTAIRLVSMNKEARPTPYKMLRAKRSPFYARVMPWTGMIITAFIIFHLLHFTVGKIMPEAYNQYEGVFNRHDVHAMVVAGFKNIAVSASYIFAMLLLSLHLAHGVTSFLQTLGINHPKYNKLFAAAGPLYGALIFFGNCSIPVAILAGVIK